MFVSPDGLDAGAGRCDDASATASAGAEILGGVSIDAGIFGDFDAAHIFHGVARDVHDHHVGKFTAHADHLTGLSGKGQVAADAFTTADQQSEQSIDRQMP